MGQYINPSDMTKEAWLEKHGTEVEPVWPLENDSKMLVCLVLNPVGFTAAALCFDQGEWDEFTRPDDLRPKRWFIVSIEDLKAVGPF